MQPVEPPKTVTVWVLEHGLEPVERQAMRLDHEWWLVKEKEGSSDWKQVYRGNVHPSPRAALTAKLQDQERYRDSVQRDIERLKNRIAQLPEEEVIDRA